MSFMNEFFKSIFRTLGRVAAYIIIGLIIYFICSNFVDASVATLGGNNVVEIRNSSGTVLATNTSNSYPNQATLSATTSNSQTNTKFRITLPNSTWATANFDYIVSYTIIVRNNSASVVNLSLTQTKVYWEGGTQITDGCSTTFSRSDSAVNNYMDQSYFYVTTSCYGISPPSNKENIYIETPLTTISSGGLYAFRGISLTNAQRDFRGNDQEQDNSDVVNSINSQTNTIINNDNANTDKITSTIEEQYNTCTDYNIVKNNSTSSNDIHGALNNNGNIVETVNPLYVTSDYYYIMANKQYKIERNYNSTYVYCTYKMDKTLISCQSYTSSLETIITPTENGYIRFTYNANSGNITTFTGEYCYNRLDKQAEATEDVAEGLQNVADILSGEHEPSYDFFDDIGLTDDTPVTNLLLIPITLLSAFNSGVSGTCQPVSLGTLYGTELILPCINLEQRLGSNLWSIIDDITAIFIIYELAMLIIAAFEDLSSLNDSFDSLYVPKHADTGYKPRHAKE